MSFIVQPASASTFTGVLGVTQGGTAITASGTAGNVLTSDGTAWASLPAGYPSKTFVATGALTNGDVVVLNTDGTVSIVSGTSPAVGTAVTTIPTMSQNADACYDPTTGKVVVAFQNTYPYYMVGTVSGTTITWGTQGNIQGLQITNDTISCCSIGNGKVAFSYALYGIYADSVRLVIGTISGTSISLETIFDPGVQIAGSRIRFDSINNRIALLMATTGQAITLYNFSYSGTTLTQLGTVAVITASATPSIISSMLNMSCDTSVGRMILMYCDRSNSGYGTAQVANMSTNAPTLGAKSVFNSAATSYISGCYDPINNKTVICYQNSTTYGTAIVGTATSTTISFGTAQIFNSAATNYIGAVYCSFQKRIAIIWNGFSLSASLSGTTLSFQTAVSNSGCYGAVAYDSTQYKVAYTYSTNSQVFEPGYTTVTNWVGVATNSASGGGDVDVAMLGAVVTNQTGLTTGTTYYLSSTGALTTSSSATGYKIGKALSATNLLITEGNAA